MVNFQRIDPLRSVLPLKYVAFVGAGGKTSFIEYLAERLVREDKTVAITTTTKIYAREPYQLINNCGLAIPLIRPMVRTGKTLEDGKLTAVGLEDVLRLGELYDIVLIEADGAKGKPLKYPAPYEPVIPSFVERVYVVGGLDALYQQVRDVVFRWELLRDSTGIDGNTVVTPDVFLRFFSEHILLKGVDTQKCCIVLNKYDTLKQKSCGSDIARRLCSVMEWSTVIVSSVSLRAYYKISTE